MTRLRSTSFGAAGVRLRSTGFGEAGHRLRVRSRIRWVCATAVAVLLCGGSTVFACPVCFGAEETPMIEGTQLGILVLLGITLSVQGAFVGFFLYLRKRAKCAAENELDTEWSELQSGASRSS